MTSRTCDMRLMFIQSWENIFFFVCDKLKNRLLLKNEWTCLTDAAYSFKEYIVTEFSSKCVFYYYYFNT